MTNIEHNYFGVYIFALHEYGAESFAQHVKWQNDDRMISTFEEHRHTALPGRPL